MQSIYPVLKYDDAHAAIDFLERAFGFERHAVYDGENGGVGHAELRFGDEYVMLGGATIERELTDQDYGSREYTARDTEGNLWSFGTYRPGTEPTAS
ncbi:MAG TPA: hypothetical protein VER75_05580 [Thermoleophilaceae bacterium]|nr:hypothetical protein [Thermoleophilaceae bacterium]